MNSTYERFVEANKKLYECYEKVAPIAWEQMGTEEKYNLCKDERNTVIEFLNNNELRFSNLLKERLEIVKSQTSD